MKRYWFPKVILVVVVWTVVLAAQTVRSQTTQPALPGTQPSTPVDPAIQKSVDAAVKYFISKQNKDGSICDLTTEQTAITAMAIMALRSSGVQISQHTDASAVMGKAMAWSLQDARLRPDGYFGNDGSCMYTHGITTLMLAQMSGAGIDDQQNALIRDRLQKAVDLILQAQKNNQAGGWRYEPGSADADVSVTLWQTRALATARRAGINVPDEAFTRAADFVKTCTANHGGFSYVPGRPDGWADSAAGLLILELCGKSDCPEAKSAIEYLQARGTPPDRERYLYGCPTYLQAMGGVGPDDMETARANVANTVLRWQQTDGSWLGWPHDNENGQVYSTALVIMSLTAKPPPIKQLVPASLPSSQN